MTIHQVYDHSIEEEPAYDSQEELDRNRAMIRALYESGKPFFTKERIRSINEQIKQRKPGEKIIVEGLDSNFMEFVVKTGQLWRAENDSEENVFTSPVFNYQSIQHLLSRNFPFITTPRSIFYNIRISYSLCTRNAITKEWLPPQHLSREETDDIFQTAVEKWESGKACDELRSLLKTIEFPFEVNKIIGIACGSMTWLKCDRKWRTATQHALLLTVRDILAKRQGNSTDIACYAQDPAYTDVDISIMKEAGISVLDDPEAFLEMDESSVVFSCSPNIPVKQITLDITKPAIFITCSIENESENSKGFTTDPDSTRIYHIVNTLYDAYDFPEDRVNFLPMKVYVRKASN